MPSTRQEIITLTVRSGTRDLLKQLREHTGLTKEDVFKLGLRYIALRETYESKKAAGIKGKIAGAINVFRRNITPTTPTKDEL